MLFTLKPPFDSEQRQLTFEAERPLSGGMEHRQHVDMAPCHPVCHDEGQARDYQLAGACNTSLPSYFRELCQTGDSFPDALTDHPRRTWPVLLDIGANFGKVRQGSACIADLHRNAA